MYGDCNFSTSLPALFIYFVIAFLVDMKWYLIVVLIYISLMTKMMLNAFLCAYKTFFSKIYTNTYFVSIPYRHSIC